MRLPIAWREMRSAEIVDYNNLILLNARRINTTTPHAQSIRGAPGREQRQPNASHSVQGADPPRVVSGACRAQAPGSSHTFQIMRILFMAALSVCTQCSNWPPAIRQCNGRENTPRLTDWIRRSQVARAHRKLDNRSAKGNEQFTIQLVEDAAENATTLAMIEQLKLEPVLAKENVLGYVNVKVALPKDAVINQIAQRGDVVSIQPFVTPRLNDEREDVIMSGNLDWKCADRQWTILPTSPVMVTISARSRTSPLTCPIAASTTGRRPQTTSVSTDWAIQPIRVIAASSIIAWLERQTQAVPSRDAMDTAL